VIAVLTLTVAGFREDIVVRANAVKNGISESCARQSMKTKTSTHHDRVFGALEGRWADRVPICEQAFASTVASRILGREMITGSTDVHYYEACAWLDGEQAHEEFVERLYKDCIALHRFFDFDIFFLPWRNTVRPTRRLTEHRILFGSQDGSDWGVGQFDPASHTFGESESGRPIPTSDEVMEMLRKRIAEPQLPRREVSIDPLLARAVREYGDEFVVAGSAGMGVPMQPGWLEVTLLEPELIAEYLDRVVEDVLALIDALHRSGIRVINGGGDFAFNSGPIYSPKFFSDVMAPRWKRIFDHCRQNGQYYIFRSDGNLWSVADALFGRARPHAYYECDYEAGMRFGELRARFPELTLVGNVSCAYLATGQPEEIKRRVTECIEAAGPRVIAGTSNSVLHGTPPENVFALFDTAKAWKPPR
jgi:uroporphyrinogen-III decarboxylase